MPTTEDVLFNETEGSCAYCGIKDYRVLTVHHITQQEPKDDSYGNKIILCHNCHHMYHQNKGPSDADLRIIKKRLIYKTLTQQGINALKEAYRKGFVVAYPYLVNHLVELGLLRYIQTITSFSDGHQSVDISASYELTDEGMQFTEKWQIK